MTEKFGWKQWALHKVSELPVVDAALQKRAEWFLQESGMLRHLNGGGRYLDVGTGKGHISQQMLVKMEQAGVPLEAYYGIDVSDKPLQRVQKREAERLEKAGHGAPNNLNPMGFVWASAHQLPFKDKSMDGASCIFSIHHISAERTDEVFRELLRVVKDDGRLFVAEDIVENNAEREATERVDRKLNFEDAETPHNYKSDREWTEYFSRKGLEVVEKRFFESESYGDRVRHGFYVLKRVSEPD